MIILAAFEPFGGRGVNRAAQTVARVPERPGVEKRTLPVDFAALRTVIPALVAERPRALLLVGEAGGRTHVAVERRAYNLIDARLPDNRGAQPRGEPLDPAGPAERAACWDPERARAALAAGGLDVRLSDDPGRFACNAALYLALAAALPEQAVGFVHVPVCGWPFGPSLRQLAAGMYRLLLTFDDARVTSSGTGPRSGDGAAP